MHGGDGEDQPGDERAGQEPAAERRARERLVVTSSRPRRDAARGARGPARAPTWPRPRRRSSPCAARGRAASLRPDHDEGDAASRRAQTVESDDHRAEQAQERDAAGRRAGTRGARCSSGRTGSPVLASFSPTSGTSSIPRKTCTDTSGRIARMVTPSAASRTSRTAAVAAGQAPVALAAARPHAGRGDGRRLVPLCRRTSSTGAMAADVDERTMRALIARSRDAATMRAMRVLVVEDEPKLAGLLARGLARGGASDDVAGTRRGRALDGAARRRTTRSCST